jgi:hypothetical protein
VREVSGIAVGKVYDGRPENVPSLKRAAVPANLGKLSSTSLLNSQFGWLRSDVTILFATHENFVCSSFACFDTDWLRE